MTVCVFTHRSISEFFLVKDLSSIPNYLWFEYTSVRQETRWAITEQPAWMVVAITCQLHDVFNGMASLQLQEKNENKITVVII